MNDRPRRPRLAIPRSGPVKAAPPGRDKEKNGSIVKALGIIEAVVKQRRPTSTAELVTLLGFSRPTGHRIAAALEDLGFLQRAPNSRRFIEGDRLVSLALDVLSAASRRGLRHSVLQALTETTGETSNFGVMAGGEVIYLDRVEAQWPLGLRFQPGSRVPIHCTALGKMFLSQMPEKQREAYVTTIPLTRYTDHTITNPAKLLDELKRVAAEGVSTDDQEFMSGVVCVATPVRGTQGQLFGGVAISAPEARLTLEEARRHLPTLREAARKLAISFESDD